MRTTFDRIHYAAASTTVPAFLVLAAALLQEHFSASGLEAFAAVALLFVLNPALVDRDRSRRTPHRLRLRGAAAGGARDAADVMVVATLVPLQAVVFGLASRSVRQSSSSPRSAEAGPGPRIYGVLLIAASSCSRRRTSALSMLVVSRVRYPLVILLRSPGSATRGERRRRTTSGAARADRGAMMLVPAPALLGFVALFAGRCGLPAFGDYRGPYGSCSTGSWARAAHDERREGAVVRRAAGSTRWARSSSSWSRWSASRCSRRDEHRRSTRRSGARAGSDAVRLLGVVMVGGGFCSA